MTTLTAQKAGAGPLSLSFETLEGDDALNYDSAYAPLLIISNETESQRTVRIKGSDAGVQTTTDMGELDLSSGYPIEVPAGKTKLMRLTTIDAYMKGDITITNGQELKAALIYLGA
ncbi:hypothetical protein [Phytohalomonas tamaricis]|uniref:hypothetical protein n=1 Tax=Phytohalomonas tamaricis TaxID=2081032 RepID=UPI000D0B6768|nr:hypothetical protein [Phytohalomonas tamaricis]